MFFAHLVQRTVKRQEGFDSWPAAMQQPMYPGNMQAPAKPMRGQITEDFMRDIMQQGYNVPPPMKKKQADRNIPGWSISANGPDNYPTDIPQNFSPDLPESFTSEAQPNYTGNALQNYASNIPQNFTASIEPKFSSNAPQISFQTPADPALMETGVLPEDYYGKLTEFSSDVFNYPNFSHPHSRFCSCLHWSINWKRDNFRYSKPITRIWNGPTSKSNEYGWKPTNAVRKSSTV